MKNWIKGLGVIAIFLAFIGIYSFKASALDGALGRYKVYQKTCTGTAATLASSAEPISFQSFKFWVNSATPVYMGGDDVNTTTKGMPFCTDSATCVQASDTIDGAPSALYCKTGGSSVTVTIFAGKP